jgi:hypothetical protein
MPGLTGYVHPDYARSLVEFGEPLDLPRSGGWILCRPIPGFSDRDAMGCYPLFACVDWSLLRQDLDALEGGLVSLGLVADPFGRYEIGQLEDCFDSVIPYKTHFVLDLERPAERVVSKEHRYYARKALQRMRVEACPDPSKFLDEWVALYEHLVRRHGITGIRAFSKAAFRRQLTIPGTIVVRAVSGEETIGADWYFVQDDVAYNHLAACAPGGYELGASYAMKWAAIEYLSGRARWLDLGGGAGLAADGRDGLSLFRRGWSTESRTAYFCGRILDRERYETIVQTRNGPATTYFPAYRDGEFAGRGEVQV